MKYENFEKAKAIVGNIDDFNKTIKKIENSASLTFESSNGFPEFSFILNETSDVLILNREVSKFRAMVINYFIERVEDLKSDLEKL